MDYRKILEEADALKVQAIELLEQAGAEDCEKPAELREQAEKMLADAGEKVDSVKAIRKAEALDEYINKGLGSLTAGSVETKQDDGNGQPPRKVWRNPAEFMAAITVAGGVKMGVKEALKKSGVLSEDWQEKLLQEGVGASGGFLVPVEYREEFFMKAWENSIVRPRATIIPMSTRSIQMPTLDQTITPVNQKSAFFGGLNYEWTEEGAAKPEQDIAFKLVELVAYELAGWIPVTNNLLEDSAISLDAILRKLMPASMADAEDYWFLQGNGVGKPMGAIHSPATIQPVRAGATAIVYSDILEMIHAFQPGANGVWVIHICCKEEICKLKDGNNNYLWVPNFRDGMPTTLMGYPVIWSEKASTLGTKGDILLADFSYYLIGDRRGPSIEASIHEKFRYNQTTYRISERVDGKPWLSADVDLRPAGASSVSPFVALDAYA